MRVLNKLLCIVLAVVLVIPTLGTIGLAAEAETILFSYDFDTYAAGKPIAADGSKADAFSAVHANVATSSAVIAAYDDGGNICAEFSNSGDSFAGPRLIRRTNFSKLTNLTVSYRAKGERQLQFVLHSGTSHSIYNSTPKLDAWTETKIVMDIKNAVYDVYVNGKVVLEKQVLPEFDNAGAVEVRFATGLNPGQTVYIDDILMTTTDEATAEEIFLTTDNANPPKILEPEDITEAPEKFFIPKDMHVLLLDDMEAHTGGLSTEQWTSITGNKTYINAVNAAGNQVAAWMNRDTAPHGPRMEKMIGVPDLKTLWFSVDYLTGSKFLNIELFGEGTQQVRLFDISKGAKVVRASGWNRLTIKMDVAGGKATAYVNDKTVQETNLSSITSDTRNWRLRIACTLQPNQVTYLDNFAIYTPDSLDGQIFSYDGTLHMDKVMPSAPTGMLDIMRAHPRLIITDWDEIREKINTDFYCARWYKAVKKSADMALEAEPTVYKVNVRGNINDASHTFKRRVMMLAFIAAVERSDVYKNRLLEEIRYVRDNWPDWGEAVYIVYAHVLMGHAVAYDWCYDLFTEEERAEVLSALMEDGIPSVIRAYEGRLTSGAVLREQHNQNMVGTASNLFAAIAIADEHPLIADYIIEKSRESIDYTLVEIGKDGAFSEPIEYWNYGVGHLMKYMIALDTSIRDSESVPSALDISNTPGMDMAADFPIYYQGPVGFFNYGDSVSTKASSPMLLYLANKYNKPQYAWYHLKLEEEEPSLRLIGKEAIMAIAFYNPDNISAGDFPLDKSYQSTEKYGVNGMSMRSSWNDDDVLFAAMQGGDNSSFHQHYSLGTFMLEYAGERFIHQTGKHAASGSTYNFTSGGKTEQFYHVRAEGNNTLLINPDETPGQKKTAMATLEKFEAGQNTSYGILNMTSVHDDYADAKRGMMITDNRRKIIIQDEVKAKKPSEFYWFAHTDAQVAIADDGKSALMTKNGKRIYVRLAAAPDSARFSLMALEPLPLSPNPDAQKGEYLPGYSGDKKLTVHVTDVQEMTLSVEFIALKDGEGVPMNLPDAVPMSAWKADSAADKPLVQTLGGSVALRIDSPAAFAGGKRTYVDTNNYNVVPFTENGRTLVPVRFISENFGAQVDWNAVEQLVTVQYKNKTIQLKLGDDIMDVNGEKITLDVPAKTVNARTLIPLRALVEALGKYVFWDDRGLIIISDDEASYEEDAIVSALNMLSQRIVAGDTEIKDFNPEITDYYVEVKDANALPQVSLVQTGTPAEAVVTQGNPATIAVNGTTYKIYFVQNPFLGSKYVANTITDFYVRMGGEMDAPETEPIIPVADVTSSVEWGTYPKEGSIDGVINDQPKNRWTGYGAQWICYDFGSVQSIHSLALATTNSHSRVFYLDIEVSADGLNWTTVKTDAVTNKSPMPTIFELGDVQARFVRLNAKKASDSAYSSYAEVRFYKNHADEQLDWASWNDRFGLNVAAGKAGDTLQLSIVAKNTFGDNVDLSQYKVTYESKNPEIAEVDANGKVTLKSKGVATVLIKAESFGMMTQGATLIIGVE